MSVLSVSLEHIVSVLSSLLKNTSGSQQQRLLGKFTENDHEKVDRLVELHFKYLDKLRAIDDKIELAKRVGTLRVVHLPIGLAKSLLGIYRCFDSY